MKREIGIIALLIGSIASAYAAKSAKITVGPLQHDHAYYPVVIDLNAQQIANKYRSQLGAYIDGQEVSSQLDDLDGDGVADEMALLLPMHRGEKKTVVIRAAKQHAEFEKEVHAEMYLKSKTPKDGYTYHEAEGKQFYICPVTEQTFTAGEDSYNQMHHHGVAFESDLMAYRIYFDKKQTIDVYAKKTPQLEIDACKWYPTDEQLQAGFGDDILRVSGMIGVGACKPWNGQKMVHFDDVTSRTQRIVSQGNVRTICEVISTGWKVDTSATPVDITTRYTLYAHHRDVQVEVMCSSAGDDANQSFTLCTGVQMVGKKAFHSDELTVSSWGTAWPVNDTVKYAKETVGLATYVPKEYYDHAVDDGRNNLILLRPGTYVRYYFTCVAQKENCPPAKSEDEFVAYVKEWAETLEDY
ncbi:MAG: DUF4861 domain-containing protein [Paludibacteraceae bacterium]|nr:DUF4861 domain-containing protein [Paludibacteraceae bacterium]